MPEKTTSKVNVFVWWGIFLLAFPAIAGTLFALFMNGLVWLHFAVYFSYVVWGWVPVIAGVIVIGIGVARFGRTQTRGGA